MTGRDWAAKKDAGRPSVDRRFGTGIKNKRQAADILIKEYMTKRDRVLYGDLCMLMRLHAKLVISQRQRSRGTTTALVRSPLDITAPAVRLGFNWQFTLPEVLRCFNDDVSDEDIAMFHGVIRGLLESDFCTGRPKDYVVPNLELAAITQSFNEGEPRTRMGFVPEFVFP